MIMVLDISVFGPDDGAGWNNQSVTRTLQSVIVCADSELRAHFESWSSVVFMMPIVLFSKETKGHFHFFKYHFYSGYYYAKW